MEVIVDTNALSAFVAGDPFIDGLLEKAGVLVPAIVLGEILAGLPGTRLAAVFTPWLAENIDNDDVILEVTRHTARHYAEVWNELRILGRPIPHNDIWIAALAREHDMPIVSRDAHFDLIPKVQRLSW